MNTFEPQLLTKLIRAHVDANPDTIRISPIATGKHNSSYWVATDKGRFVLRVAPADDAGFLFYERLMMRQEPALHALVRANTSIPIAEVVGYDFSRSEVDRDYLLLTALPGTPISDASGLTRLQFDRAVYQVGEYLQQLHALTASIFLDNATELYGYLGNHQPMPPQPDWPSAFRTMWNLLIDDVAACGGYSFNEA